MSTEIAAPWLVISLPIFIAANFGFLMIRYFFLGVIPFLILFSKKYKKIQSKLESINRGIPSPQQVLDEVIYSMKSMLIFISGSVFIYFGARQGWVTLYANISDYGWIYYLLTIVVLLLIQDTWFYWTHRLLHTPRFFKWAHSRHHASVNTTPLSAFSFNAFEAFIHSSIAMVAYCWFPVHPSTFFVFQMIMALQNLYAHSGYEIIPQSLQNRAPFKWWITSRVHHHHHQVGSVNYGLYFRFWDKLMKTSV